jgi:hypothetical protein
MAATITPYTTAPSHFANGAIDIDTDTIKVSLHLSTYSVNLDTDDFHNDATNELAASGGYTAGGNTIANITRTVTGATNVTKIDGDDVTFTALTPSAPFRYGVIYKDRGGASTADELIALIDFGANQDSGGSDFVIQWNANGIVTFTVV